MLRTWVTEDVIVISTGFILFLSLTSSYVGKQEEYEKEMCTEVVKEFFLFEKHQ